MAETEIQCPKCGHRFPLSDSLAANIRAELQEQFAAERDKAAREAAQAAERAAQARAKEAEAELRAQLAELSAALKAAQEQDARRQEQMREANAAKAEALRLQRQVAEEREALELKVEERLTVRLAEEKRKADERVAAEVARRIAQAAEEQTQRMAEKDQQMEVLKRQIEALKQKAEQGSMQTQGEAAEVVLEDRLSQTFPADEITPVGKGMRGADCIQAVRGPGGPAGRIIWESKNARNWSNDWIPKLKADMREAGAEIAVLCSAVLPQGLDWFGEVDGVWVCQPRYAPALASSLRQALLRAAEAEARGQGRETKMELIYDYLTGTQFKARVQAIIEAFQTMQADLDAEKRVMLKHWKKRETQIAHVVNNTAAMHGELQGIAGASMPQIEALELAALVPPDEED